MILAILDFSPKKVSIKIIFNFEKKMRTRLFTLYYMFLSLKLLYKIKTKNLKPRLIITLKSWNRF
jgi:hypothetical protein